MNVPFGGMHWEKLAFKWNCHGQDTFGVKIKYLMEWYQQDLVCKSTLFYVDFNGERLRINLQFMSSSIKVFPNWIEDIKLKSPSKREILGDFDAINWIEEQNHNKSGMMVEKLRWERET